jgi:hypothetical protein
MSLSGARQDQGMVAGAFRFPLVRPGQQSVRLVRRQGPPGLLGCGPLGELRRPARVKAFHRSGGGRRQILSDISFRHLKIRILADFAEVGSSCRCYCRSFWKPNSL